MSLNKSAYCWSVLRGARYGQRECTGAQPWRTAAAGWRACHSAHCRRESGIGKAGPMFEKVQALPTGTTIDETLRTLLLLLDALQSILNVRLAILGQCSMVNEYLFPGL